MTTDVFAIAQVSQTDAQAVLQLVRNLAAICSMSDDPDLLRRLPMLSHQLPEGLRSVVNDFRLDEEAGCLVLRGFAVDDGALGPTPDDWRNIDGGSIATKEHELMMLTVSALLGEPFAWRTQQSGRMIHDILPIRRDEDAQLGSSSRALLTWHNEDAFHEARADHVVFFALRNPDRVATTVGRLNVEELAPEVVELLFEERFYILPDYSHFAHTNTAVESNNAFEQIRCRSESPPAIAALTGAREAPYVRLDPFFMRVLPEDVEAEAALEAVTKVIDASLEDVVLEPGDLMLLDNLRVVHGRKPFLARYDGTDRWLKRSNVARDIRRSRPHRESAASRVVG